MSIHLGLNVGLTEVLANKEVRVKRQGEWLKRHSLPLVSFSVNMPGPQKMTECTQKIFELGVEAIHSACYQKGWDIAEQQLLLQVTGPEAIFAIKSPNANQLKYEMMQIEQQHFLGRIMDIDVIDIEGKIVSRKGQGLTWRQCLLCDDAAAVCARSRKHELHLLVSHIESMVSSYEHSAKIS